MKRKRPSVQEFLDSIWGTPPQHDVEAACDRVWKKLQEVLDKRDTSLWSLDGDGWSAPATNQLEFQILSAASSLGERADLDGITDMVEGWTGRTMIARVQAELCDMERRGLINVRRSRPAGSDGEPFIYFQLTRDGDRALRRAHAENKHLMQAQESPIRGEAKERIR
jgi:hypothetical protein